MQVQNTKTIESQENSLVAWIVCLYTYYEKEEKIAMSIFDRAIWLLIFQAPLFSFYYLMMRNSPPSIGEMLWSCDTNLHPLW